MPKEVYETLDGTTTGIADGAGAWAAIDTAKDPYFTFAIDGTFDGGTVTLEIESNGGTLLDTSYVFIAPGMYNVELRGDQVRADVRGTGGSPALTAWLMK
jgi:hypothetical protein